MAVKCILTGQTPSVLDGVTENVQSQIDAKANDSEVVHLTGNETIAGTKTFTGGVVMKGGADVASSGNAVLNVEGVATNTDYIDMYVSGGTNTSRPLVLQNNSTGSGNVGIGIATPSEKLEVSGNVKATKFKGDGSELTNVPYPVTSVAGKTGAVTLAASDVGAQPKIDAAAGLLKTDGSGNVSSVDALVFEKYGETNEGEEIYNALLLNNEPVAPQRAVLSILEESIIDRQYNYSNVDETTYTGYLTNYSNGLMIDLNTVDGHTCETTLLMTPSNQVILSLVDNVVQDGFRKFEFSGNDYKILGIPTPTTDDGAANKAYVDTKQPAITASGILQGDGAGNITAAEEAEVSLVSLTVDMVDGAAPLNRILNITLPAANWAGDGPYTQTVTISGGTANTKVDIMFDADTYQQMVDDGVGYLAIANEDGTFTATAKGGQPSADLNIQVECKEVTPPL